MPCAELARKRQSMRPVVQHQRGIVGDEECAAVAPGGHAPQGLLAVRGVHVRGSAEEEAELIVLGEEEGRRVLVLRLLRRVLHQTSKQRTAVPARTASDL